MIVVPLVGAAMIVVTVVVESVVMAGAVNVITRFEPSIKRLSMVHRTVIVMSPLSLWLLFAGIGSAMWFWAALLVGLDQFDTYTTAMYFTSVSATTLGYGDLVLSEDWRLLSGFIAANGLLLFSLNTAFLFDALRRVNQTENKK